MIEVAAVLAGRYEIYKEIGRGGKSVVYLAMDTHLMNKRVAVKVVKKDIDGYLLKIAQDSLWMELTTLTKIDHPGVSRIVDFIDGNTAWYVVMDFIDGESLKDLLRECGPQSEEYVLDWAKQLCAILSYLHSQRPPIVYRGMEPGNVMLKPDGSLKLINFGMARRYNGPDHADTVILGTTGYAPPEQYTGHTDPRSDIYALGMTMHSLLTGVDHTKNKDGYIPVRMYNPALSEGIELIINRCVQPAPENRYQNCRELLYDLEHPKPVTGKKGRAY